MRGRSTVWATRAHVTPGGSIGGVRWPTTSSIRGGTIVDGSGSAALSRRCRCQRRGIAAVGRIDEARPAGGRRRRPRGDAGLHRRPHPHGRPGVLGSARQLLVLARRHQRGDGQLWLHAGARRRVDERHLVVRNLERAEDISAEAMAAGIEWSWETSPVPRRRRRPAQGDQLRGLRRALGAAHVRDGRARLRGGRDGRRPRGDGARAARRAARRGDRASHLAHARNHLRPTASRWPPGWRSGRRSSGWSARWANSAPGCSSWPTSRRSRARDPEVRAECQRPPAQAGRGHRRAGDVRRARGGRPADLARPARPARRDGGRRRADVRPDALPRRLRAAVVQDPPAVRQAAGVARAARPAARCPGGAAPPPGGA